MGLDMQQVSTAMLSSELHSKQVSEVTQRHQHACCDLACTGTAEDVLAAYKMEAAVAL